MIPEPLERVQFEAGDLIYRYPPRWRHPNKVAVYDIACSTGFPFEGLLRYTRWPEMEMPETVTSRCTFQVLAGAFVYIPSPEKNIMDWHMNFADPYLFVAYDSTLLAQDELQVAEHPALGSLRDALIDMGKHPMTVDFSGRPTPITITGVQRRCAIKTRPDPQAGLSSGLYGNAFALAPVEQVRAATRPLSPPTISNILAMAAPPGGYGTYSKLEIEHILSTAFSGFSGAQFAGQQIGGGDVQTLIHTGFWGCGAFGGNRDLMTMLQALAGDLTGVGLVFHAMDENGAALAQQAYDRYTNIRESVSSVPQIIGAIHEMEFAWGVSDGN